MKAYIATALTNIDEYVEVKELFKKAGFEITYDWSTTGDLRRAVDDVKELVCKKELEAVKAADVVVVLSPGKRGTHIEIGYALAFEKPIILYHGEENIDVIFYSHPNVKKINRSIGYLKLIDEVNLHMSSLDKRKVLTHKINHRIESDNDRSFYASAPGALLLSMLETFVTEFPEGSIKHKLLQENYVKNRKYLYGQDHIVTGHRINDILSIKGTSNG